MILLTSTSDLVELVTSGTTTLHVQASYVDLSGSGTVATPGRQNTIVSSATTTTIVGSPGTSTTQRALKFLSIQNTSSSVSQTITVEHTDGTNVVQLMEITIQPLFTLVYNDPSGWILLDSSGGRLEVPLTGRLLASTVLTSTTSATFTTGLTTHTIRIRGVGGGGGGGGCASVAAAAGAAGGGGAGSYAEAIFPVSPNTGYTYQCGAGGTGTSAAAGGNGGNSTFTAGGVTVTCNGGSGAPLCTPTTTLLVTLGGAGGAVSTNGACNGAGESGEPGIQILVSTPIVGSGAGGSTVFGGGGLGLAAVGSGNNAVGYGAGGSGGATGATQPRAGGVGAQGVWIVDEFA
jgi:hypothetical protein